MLPVLLAEIGESLHADRVWFLEAHPEWPVRCQFHRRGNRIREENFPRSFLSEILDRGAGSVCPPEGPTPAYLAGLVPGKRFPDHVILASRHREEFTHWELEYAVACGHYLSLVSEKIQICQKQQQERERLKALLHIAEQLVEERQTGPLLNHIAEQATQLLQCERASIFLWDTSRNELVGRPALGLPNGELRIPDDVGVVGAVLKSGQVLQVDDVQTDPIWNSQVDSSSGFQTRNLLCIPMNDVGGKRVGVLEVMNKHQGVFQPTDVETLQALGRQTVAALKNVQEREALLRTQAEFEDQARLACRIVGECPKIKALRG